MGYFLTIIFILFIIGITLKSKKKQKRMNDKSYWPDEVKKYDPIIKKIYRAKPPLTQTEIKCYKMLVETLPDLVVLTQVNLSSFIKPNSTENYSEETTLLNAISRQSVDFLICLPHDMSIVAAIELDDYTHNRKSSIKRDEKKDKNLEIAGIKLIRMHCENMPSTEKIKSLFYGEHQNLSEITKVRNGNQ